jgi:hypothetical protein
VFLALAAASFIHDHLHMADILDLLGEASEADWYRARFQALKTEYHAAFFDAASGVYGDTGALTCWGAAPAVPSTGYDLVAPGTRHTCASRGDTLACWGDDSQLQTHHPRRSGVSFVTVGVGKECRDESAAC